MNARPLTVHECPPAGGSLTRCCLKPAGGLPLIDLFTRDPCHVTCTVRDIAEMTAEQDRDESPFGWSDLPARR